MIRREIVEAGAGCGKTESLVRRYIEALDRGMAPAEIIALTFTEEAARQMKERLLLRLKEKEDDNAALRVESESKISTFHSLCFKILIPRLKELGYPAFAPLYPPELARAIRRKFVLRYLAEHPRREEYLRHLKAGEIADMGASHFFRAPTLPEGTEIPERARRAFEVFREATRRELEALFAQYPEQREKEWTGALYRALEEPTRERAAKIEFRAGRKMSKEFPGLAQAAKDYRAFFEDYDVESLSEARWQADLDKQKLFLDFFNEAAAAAPKILDFEALEEELLRLVRRGPPLSKQIKARLLIVDEFQDTNPSQFEIIQSLSSENCEWYFVGDPKQSIYAFRRAEVRLFLELKKQLQLLSLDTNYRSEKGVLDFMNVVQAKLFRADRPLDPAPQSLHCGRVDQLSPGAALRLHRFARNTDDDKIFASVLEDRAAIDAELNNPSTTHGVLFMSWKRLYLFSDYLKERKIPHGISGGLPALDHHLSEIFTLFLENLNAKGLDFASFLVARWMNENWQGETSGPLQSQLQAELTTLISTETPTPWLQIFNYFCQKLSPTRWPQGTEWMIATEELLHQYQELGSEKEFSLKELARFIRRNQESFESKLFQKSQNKTLMLYTIHGSKGLEFDALYLPEIYDGAAGRGQQRGPLLKLRSSRDPASLLEDLARLEENLGLEAEKRRLFYVALTRAKKKLCVYFEEPSDRATAANPLEKILNWPASEKTPWNELLLPIVSSEAFVPYLISHVLEEDGTAEANA